MPALLQLSRAEGTSFNSLQFAPDQFVIAKLYTNPWRELNEYWVGGLDTLRRQNTYICPWTDNKFCHFFPVLVMISSKLTLHVKVLKPHAIIDTPAHLKLWKDSNRRPDFFAQAWLGHGYDHTCLPDDGEPEWFLNAQPLSDRGYVIGWQRRWIGK